MLHTAALIVSLALAPPDSMTPKLSADLDGDGIAEFVTATAKGGTVRLQVKSGATGKKVDAKAPAPAGDVVGVTLTTAALGSVGSLLDVAAATDSSECVSVWRFQQGTLSRIPIRNATGGQLPDCEAAGQSTHRWERPAPDAPSILIREIQRRVERGTLHRRETYTFAGFSLDLDPRRLTIDVDGVRIPSWYRARLYTRAGLSRLYERFELGPVRATPQMEIQTDPERGILSLRLISGSDETLAPVESYSENAADRTVTLVARAGDKTPEAKIQLAGDGTVPIEVTLKGYRPDFDGVFAPAETYDGKVRQVFSSAADEIAARFLSGSWRAPKGAVVQMRAEGEGSYRLRVDQSLFDVNFDHAAKPYDLTLLPVDPSGKVWGLVLQGPNALDRVALSCEGADAAAACHPDGPAERLRRLGARINVN